MRLKDKVAVITGAGGGLGREFAFTLAGEGAHIAATDLDIDLLDDVVPGVKKLGRECKTYKMDVSNKASVTETMVDIYNTFGHIDILVNNAGGSLYTPKITEEITEEHWYKVLDVNLKGTFLCSQAVVQYMIKQKSGKIINVASIGGRTASIVTGVPYASAKGGIISLTRRMALEFGPYGINVNAIAPGTVLSGQRMINLWNELNEEQKKAILSSIPLGRLSTAREQATVVIFLASDDASYITGAIIDVNGGRFMS
ncbi:SDR family NAD(P)-dependent oxidoreductase [Desulfotomaculum copahuensis]|uniref:Short-chain dehydrogenase n=1 Tax=Desulfotomaculum copahuensis TaxID=1838280 RepID=A0A1B7LAG5_9FIRM|nr:glucose 1-dehydrogenase [Desulfotomaculum copahuensis]OAT79324.1 hypothetical protein A6M21_16150 [Desulfotomaculum copahuensis]